MSRIDLLAGREAPLTLNLRQPYPPSFSADGRFLACPSALGYVRIWDATTFRELASLSGFALSANSAAFAPDRRCLATGSHRGESMRLWDTDSYELLLTLETTGSFFTDAAFSPDGSALGSLGSTGLHLWRAPSWAEIAAVDRLAGSRR